MTASRVPFAAVLCLAAIASEAGSAERALTAFIETTLATAPPPLVYEELRKLAALKLAQEKPGQTLDATALVHEAYLRIVGDDPGKSWQGRPHFGGTIAYMSPEQATAFRPGMTPAAIDTRSDVWAQGDAGQRQERKRLGYQRLHRRWQGEQDPDSGQRYK
jgi:hypothetical protein